MDEATEERISALERLVRDQGNAISMLLSMVDRVEKRHAEWPEFRQHVEKALAARDTGPSIANVERILEGGKLQARVKKLEEKSKEFATSLVLVDCLNETVEKHRKVFDRLMDAGETAPAEPYKIGKVDAEEHHDFFTRIAKNEW